MRPSSSGQALPHLPSRLTLTCHQLPRWLRALPLAIAIALAGCLSPLTLDRAVLGYDQANADILSKQLLLNIARSRHSVPAHFTGVANIAATYNFQFTAGGTPAFTGNSGALLAPIFGGSASENPTISVVPLQGEEFTRRLLTPFPTSKVILLLRQNYPVDLLFRLIAEEFRLAAEGPDFICHNKPSEQVGYPLFRRIAMHLSSIQDSSDLHVESLMLRRSWVLPAETMTLEAMQSLARDDVSIQLDPKTRLYSLTKRVPAALVVTNYDPEELADDEKIQLNAQAQEGQVNDIMVDIRPGFPGGEYPFRGWFRFRSFIAILDFIGRSIGNDPEYFVEKDPRTPEVRENPNQTLDIVEGEDYPDDAGIVVEFNDLYYSLGKNEGYPWNREVFRILHQLFQMAVSEVPSTGVPSITIAK